MSEDATSDSGPVYTPGVSSSPALRLVAARGRLVTGRLSLLALAGLARVRSLRACAIWPDSRWPCEVVDLGSGQPARWLRSEFGEREVGWFRRAAVRLGGPAVTALRARALIVGAMPPAVPRAVEAALQRSLDRPLIALYSPSGMPISKVICFVFEGGSRHPTVAVQAMADPAQAARLRDELGTIETVRRRLQGRMDLESGLPLQPLGAGITEREYLAVLPVDPLAGAVGGDCREPATAWSRGLLRATRIEAAWSKESEHRELSDLRRAWSHLRPIKAEPIAERTAELLSLGRSASLPTCWAHGDYWRGNIAVLGESIRIFDWEWAEPSAHPAIDTVSFELGEVRLGVGSVDDRQLVSLLSDALDRADHELTARRIDCQSISMLAPVLGRIVSRSHKMVTGTDDPLLRMMRATEELLLR